MTGFILGSLAILWPWKNAIYRLDETGNFVIKKGEKVIQGYERFMPDSMTTEVWLAIIFMFIGIASIWIMEKGLNKEQTN